jgi:7-cyano-7-deazaguanine reductase
MNEASNELTLLGRSISGPVDHLETFACPPGCARVVFTTDEVNSLCPVTGQPDVSSVRIDYAPDQRCVESKSLKLFLWGFRDRRVFAEQLAVDIADEVQRAAQPVSVDVVVTQHARGGITTQTHASHPRMT